MTGSVFGVDQKSGRSHQPLARGWSKSPCVPSSARAPNRRGATVRKTELLSGSAACTHL
jgi:hypothetical protein